MDNRSEPHQFTVGREAHGHLQRAGQFKRVTGTIETADDGTLQSIEATIDAASIDTAEAKRDAHLRSPDFLDLEKHPNLIFRSTAIQARSDGKYLVKGNLTIREETRPVSFEVETGQIGRAHV